MQFILKILAFLAAYAPLLGIYAIRAIPSDWRASIALGVAAVIFPSIILLYVAQSGRSGNPERTVVANVTRRDDQIMAYLFTYVLPFIGLAFNDVYEVAASALFLTLLFVLFIRTNLFYVNPVLGAAGYRIYEVSIDEAPPRIILSKARFIAVGESVRLVRLVDEDIFLHVRGRS